MASPRKGTAVEWRTVFPGILKTDLEVEEQRIRQAVSARVRPIPYFETRSIHGPNTELGLAAYRAIVVIYVPPGRDARI